MTVTRTMDFYAAGMDRRLAEDSARRWSLTAEDLSHLQVPTLELERLAEELSYFPSEIPGGEERVPSEARLSSLLDIVKRTHAYDPAIFQEEGRSPFFFPAVITNNQLDTFYTRMGESSLRNYTEDAKAGVSFQNSHRRDLGFGRTVTAEYDTQARSVKAWFYTVPGLLLNDVSTDDLIGGIRSGLVKSVSIGFMGGRYVCSACGNDMFKRWADCSHYPGQIIKLVDSKGNETGRTEVVTATIEDARLGEVSAGFKNSTPGAVISKAIRLVEMGLESPERLVTLERGFRTASPTNARRLFSVPQIQGDRNMDDNKPPTPEPPSTVVPPTPQGEPPPAQQGAAGRTPVTLAVLLEEVGAPAEVRLLQEAGQRAWLTGEFSRLRGLADDGAAYRSDLTEQALNQGRRAFGDKFAEERYTAIMARSDVDAIKQFRDDWKSAADAQFPAGRQVRDKEDLVGAPGAADQGSDPAQQNQDAIAGRGVRKLPPAYYRD